MRGTRKATIRLNRTGGAVAAATGLGLSALAGLIWLAALARLPGDPHLRALRAGEPVTAADAAHLAATRRAAQGWLPTGRAHASRGLAAAVRADRGGRVRPGLRRARTRTEAALRRRPSDPLLWTRLGRLRHRLGMPRPAVAAAVQRANALGPTVPKTAPVRATLTLHHVHNLDPHGRATRRTLATAWCQHPRAIAGLARRLHQRDPLRGALMANGADSLGSATYPCSR